MMRLTKRVFSAFLAFVMVFTMLPLDVWADDVSGDSLVAPLAVPSGPEAVALELDQSSAVIQVGQEATFNPYLKMDDDSTEPATGCTWESDNREVATVEGGVVTGVSEGTATITCKLDNFETFAMVTVTNVNYRLVYESNYPEDAVKYTYQNGGSASIGSATDTTVNETYEIGATATVASGIFTTINYDLVNYLGSDGNTYNVDDTITMNSNLTLTAQWKRNGNTTSQEQITVRYYKISNTSEYVDKTVTATFTPSGHDEATVTFITGNNQDTIKEKYQDFYGWTIDGQNYTFNEQVTTTATDKDGSGIWLVKARPLRAGEEDNVVHAQFFIRKADADGYGEADQYYSVGSGTVNATDFERNPESGNIVSGTVAGSDNVNDNVNSYILTAPSAAQIANLMNITLKEASAVRWYVIKNQKDGFHVDGVIYLKDKYWRVEFVDPDTGKVVQTLLVEDADKIPVDQVISEDRLNNDLRDFTHWVDEEEKAVNLNDLVVTGDIRLTADFTRYSGYKVEYYLQNADNDEYTLDAQRTETHKEEVNEEVTVTPGRIDGYEFTQKDSITSGIVKKDETLVLKLYYDRNQYNVTYEYEVGTIPEGAKDQLPDAAKYKQGATVTVENEPVVTGYQFSGWRVQKPSSGVTIIDGEFTMPNESVTLVGSWERIIYNGETITIEVIKDGVRVPAGDYFTPENYKGGTEGFQYRLDGLQYKVDFTYDNLNCADIYLPLETPGGYTVQIASNDYGPTIGVLDDVQRPLKIDEDENGWILDNVPGGATVTVTLVPNSHTVSYKYKDLNGTVNQFGQPVSYKFDTTVKVSTDVPPAPDGYHFSGWTTDDAEVTNDSFTMPDNDVVFVGSFIANDNTPYEVQWYYQNADGSYPTTTSVTENRTGTTGTEATVTDADKAKTQNGLYVYNSDKSTEKSTITGDGTTVLKLYFERKQFSVKYEYSNEVDGAPNPPEELDYKWGTTGIQLATAPTLEGYVFSGWTTEDATVENNSFTMPQQTVTFTGSWTKLYTVTYDKNDDQATGEMNAFEVKEGGSHTVQANGFTKTNYHFVGWKDDSGNEYPVGEEIENITKDITLYAQWEIDKVGYTIEYYLDDVKQDDAPYAGAPTGGSADIDTKVDVRPMQGYRTSFGETGSHYVLDEGAENVFEITINADTTQNVLKVYYASDNKGGEEDPGTSDEIPDKYQVIFRYVAGSNGSITGIRHETITKSNVVTTAQPSGTSFAADDGYKFQKWTRTCDTAEDTNEGMDSFISDNSSYNWGSDVTFTVHFTKRTDLEYTINYYWVGDKDNQSRIPIRGPETKSDGTLGDTVTLNSINIPSIDGYTLVPDTYQVTISANEAANVINVYYYKNVTLTANSDTNGVYTGEVQTVTGFTVTDKDGTVDNVTFTGVIASGSGKNANTEENPSYPVTFTGVTENETLDTNEYYIVTETVPGKLTIEPATLTVTTESAEGEYPVGTALTADGNYTGLQNGETLTFKVTGKQEFVGSSENTYTITWDGTAEERNYTIVESLGTLTVTAPANYDYVQKTHVSTGDDGNKLTFDVGDTITFQITVHNIYDKPATVTLTEKLENVTFKENVEGVTLTAGETKTFDATYTVTQADVIKGEINNTVEWTLTPKDEDLITGEDKDEVTDLVYEPSLSVTKTVTSPAGTYALGDTIEYQIVVKNDGNVTINGIVVSDEMHEKLADGTTEKIDEGTVHYAGEGTFSGTLEPEQSATFTFEYTVQEADLGKTLVNIATATGEDPKDTEKDITGTGNTPGEKTDSPNPKLDVEKTVENADGTPFKLGETIKYKIVVTNTGNQTLADITVKDVMTHKGIEGVELTGGELLDASGEPISGDAEIAELVPAELVGEGHVDSATFYYTYTVKESDLGKTLVNVATATSGETEGENTPVEVTPDTRNPELKVVKTANQPADGKDFALGETIEYTITLTNTGNVTLNVSIRDMFGTRDDGSTIQEDITSKLTCQSENFNGTLEPDASVTYTYSYTVTEADLGKDIVNTVKYTAVDDTNVPAQQNEESVTEVTSQTDDPNPNLKVVKTVLNPNEAPFDYNKTIQYQITVTNTGNVTLTNVSVEDVLKDSLGNTVENLDLTGAKNFTLVPVGQTGGVSSKTFDVYYTVKEEDLGKTLVNTVTAESDKTKPNLNDPNNDDHDETDGEKTEDPTPNMEVSKTVVGDKGSYRVGDVITYQITVKNTGNTTLHNLSLVDSMNAAGKVTFTNLGGGTQNGSTVTLASLAPKAVWTVTCTYKVQLADADSGGTVISNKVVVTSDEGPDDDSETPGEDIDPIYTVVIKYQNGAGRDLHDPAVVKVHDGQKYSVDSPNVPGYHLTKANEKTVSGTLDATNPYISEEGVLTLVVVYARNPVEDDDDDPVVNPDNDPDETTEETEDEVDPGVYIEDPDDYTLTPITEEEPPLADLDVGDHTCCIMHFLLMLAAMVVLGFYTDSKKKHQARIFELKRTLAMEKGKNPDGDNSQQS